MIRRALLLLSTTLLLALQSAPSFAQESERCGAQVGPDSAITTVVIPGYSVLTAPVPFTAPAVDGQLRAIMCGRSHLYIAPNDYHVLTDLHVPLYLVAGDRIASLEISGGQLRLRFLRGALTPDEEAGVQEALDRAQTAIQAPP